MKFPMIFLSSSPSLVLSVLLVLLTLPRREAINGEVLSLSSSSSFSKFSQNPSIKLKNSEFPKFPIEASTLKNFEFPKFPIEASTMKQKIVIKVSMKNEPTSIFSCFCPQSSHSKALRLAGGFPGVQSVALAGDRDKIEVTGELDAVELTTLLRNKVGCAEIESVAEVKPQEKKDDAKPIQWWYPRQEVVYVHPEPGWW